MNSRLRTNPTAVLVTRLTRVIALAAALLPITAYWTFSYLEVSTQLEHELKIQALVMDDFIAAQPEGWDVSTDRVLGELDRFLSRENGFGVFNAKGAPVAQIAPKHQGYSIKRSRAIHDFGTPVGYIEVQTSINKQILIGLGLFVVSLVFAWLLWVPIRKIPLNALADTELQLKTRESYQRTLLNNFPFIVWLKGIDGRYLTVNEKFIELTCNTQNIRHIDTVNTEHCNSEIKSILESNDKELFDHGKVLRYESPVNIQDRIAYLSIYKSPVYLNNEIIGIAGYAMDITEQKRLEETLIQSEKMMSVGGLAAGMAHEINNPLSGIMQSLQVIQRRLMPGSHANIQAAEESGCSFDNIQRYIHKREIPSFIEAIHLSGSRAADIVSRMLEFSRKADATQTTSDVNSLIDQALEICSSDYNVKSRADFSKIRVIRDFSSELPYIECFPPQILQVLVNLLRNAFHAMALQFAEGPPPTITLRTWFGDDKVNIEVEDNGPGIEESIRRKVFEPFFTTKPVGEGTGLGLSVSYFIVVNHHGGTLEVESSPGKGTKFIIGLPVSQEHGYA